MELKDMKVGDILELPEFDDVLKYEMRRYKNMVYAFGSQEKRIIQDFTKRGIWNIANMKLLYMRIIHKKAVGFSSAERNLISAVCFKAYSNVIDKLRAKENESNRTDRNRENK